MYCVIQNNMKLSISNIAWEQCDDIKMYKLMKEMGFSGLEIAPKRLFDYPYNYLDEEIEKLIQLLNGYNLQVASLQSIHFGIDGIQLFGSIKQREKLLEASKYAIDLANKLGSKVIVFGSPKIRNYSDRNKDFPLAVDFFRELSEYVFSKSVFCCLEANPVIYNTNFINTTSEAIEFIKLVNSRGLKLNLDMGTIISNGETIKDLECCGDFIQHVHISEPYLNPIDKRHIRYHEELCRLLNKIDYKNWISIEMKKGNDISSIANTMKYVKSIFE